MNTIDCEVAIIGAGSGGIGAAVGAAERGARTVVIDRAQLPGGVVAACWVHNWEPTCGNGPLTRRLWERMRAMPLGAVDLPFTVSRTFPDGNRQPTMPFELWAYQRAVLAEFARFPHLNFLGGHTFVAAVTDGRRIVSVTVAGEAGPVEIRAKVFLDATGTLQLARSCGCATMLGTDARSDFNEKVAPETADRHNLNLVNWLYRVRPGGRPQVKAAPDSFPKNAWRSAIFSATMPNGDLLVNICGLGHYSPEIPGDLERVTKEQYELAFNTYCWRVASGLNPDWELVGMAPALGIRESYRLRARKVVTANDVFTFGDAYEKQWIGQTDHPLDVHGTDLEARLGSIPFGIPYDSLLPVEFDNLLVASRGLGTTHIAAGAARLSRTLMTCGQAAGRAAAISAQSGRMLETIAAGEIAEFEPCPDFVRTNAARRLATISLS